MDSVMMNNILTMSVAKISAFLNNIEYFGVHKTDILKSACINPDFLNLPDKRLTSQEANRIFLEVAKLTKNENIGLHQGERLSKGFSNILGHILMNCHNLGDAVEKYIKYEKIVDETSISEITIKGNAAVFSLTSIDKAWKGNRILSDFKVSGMLLYTQILSGKRIALKEVYFDHCKPQDISEYQRIFNCPLYFGKSTNALVFDKGLLQLPIIEPNKELLMLFEGIAQNTLERIEKSEAYTKKVLNIIVKEINGEIPSLDVVAKKLAMSTRSLQGHLKKEGTSYIKLLNEVRKDIAINCLKEKNAPIAEIAYILGFSEASAFNRAFKKWTNLTPCEFRIRNIFQ